MSSRIRADASGPGEDAHRSPPEAPGRENEVEQATQQPSDAAAEGTEGIEPRERPRDAPADDAGGEPEQQPGRDPEIQRRIDQLTRDRYEARRERDEARAQMAEWQRQQQRQQQPAGPEGEAEERAYQRFQQQRIEEDFNRQCNDLWQRGVDEYGQEMSEAKRGLDAVGWGNRPDALAALTALPDGHRVYRELAGDLDNAARILSLPPMRMAVELARMSRDAPQNAATVSRETNREPLEGRRTRAPEPLRPVGGNSRRAEMRLDDPRMTIAEHIRQRDREQWGSSRIRR